MSQQEHSRANRAAWSHRLQEATVQLGGTAEQEAAQLKADPSHTLRDYIAYLGDVRGMQVANLLGSSGKKAVALSLLGAHVTVVDFAEDNKVYALECARAAGVKLDYIMGCSRRIPMAARWIGDSPGRIGTAELTMEPPAAEPCVRHTR